MSRGNPFNDSLFQFFQTSDRLFGSVDSQLRQFAGGFSPDFDVSETPEGYTLVADVPGLTASDISVEIEPLNAGTTITVSGTRKAPEMPGKTHTERRFGAFERSFVTSKAVNEDAVSAKVENGVLTIKVAKKAVAPKTVKVPVV